LAYMWLRIRPGCTRIGWMSAMLWTFTPCFFKSSLMWLFSAKTVTVNKKSAESALDRAWCLHALTCGIYRPFFLCSVIGTLECSHALASFGNVSIYPAALPGSLSSPPLKTHDAYVSSTHNVWDKETSRNCFQHAPCHIT
jgi:hypothetical protein